MKKIIIVVSVIVVIGLFGFLAKDLLFSGLLEIEKGVNDLLKQSERKVFLPSPLFSEEDNPDSFLDKDEVIKFTNIQRQKYGLAPLKENSKLDSSAQAKAEDLFFYQYFEHKSPTGLEVSDLAMRAGYDYIFLGENLAMGNFEDDEDLVQAWMDSPGHRENILNPKFMEIGVFVLKGTFQGKETWVAVQHFALPSSICSPADETIKMKIQANEREIAKLEQTLDSMKDNLKTKKDINEFNALVLKHNDLVDQNKVLVQKYNQQVISFNQCLTNVVQ